MEENGKVVELSDEGTKVEVIPGNMCHHCGAAQACGTFGSRTKIVLAQNPIDAKIGDLVKLEIKEKTRAVSILLVFGLPIVLLLTGIIVGEILSGDKLAAILGGAGLVIAFAVVKVIDRLVNKQKTFLPTIIEKISELPEENTCPD